MSCTPSAFTVKVWLNINNFLGPVPVFFSDKPEDTLEDLKKSPEWAFKCLQALVSRLLVRGQLTR